MFKKIILVVLTSLFIFIPSLSSFATIANAQGIIDQDVYDLWNHKWYSEMDYLAWYTKVYDPDTPESEIFGERYTAAQVQWVVYSIISNLLINLIPGTPDIIICKEGDLNACLDAALEGIKALTVDTESNTNQRFSLIDTLGKSPISGIGYVNHLASKFRIVPEVSAQNPGFGYNTAGQSLIPIWSTMRDLSYGFIVIAAIVLSFMIMFQFKINPQTVMTAQAAIPRVAGAAILITFSYAIAGFAIDLMYVFIGIVAMLISGSGLTQADTLGMFGALTDGSLLMYTYLYWSIFSNVAFAVSRNSGVYGVIILIVAILAIFTVITNSVKIIVMTVKNFALLVIAIITGPIEIMMGTFTQHTGFGSWFRKILGYSVFYPVLGLMFFLVYFFLYQGGSGLTVDSSIPFFPVPDFIPMGSWTPPLTSIDLGSTPILWVAISYVIFVEIPKVGDMVQSFISGKSWGFGSGINEASTGLQNTFQKGAVDPLMKAAPGLAVSAGKSAIGWIGGLLTRFG